MKNRNSFTGLFICLATIIIMNSCSGRNCESNSNNTMSNISEKTITELVNTCCGQNNSETGIIERGIRQTASLWRVEDGDNSAFETFVKENLAKDETEKRKLYDALARDFEILFGTSNQTSIELQKPTILAGDTPTSIDYIFSSYSPSSHFSDDMFANKIAFITILNFPNWTLDEKNSHGKTWSRLEWAYARMGDIFTNRIPAEVNQEISKAAGEAENYIADYNIMMGHILNEEGEKLFPEDMTLLSHWNLRDELKSNYADIPNANQKQEMIYKIMERIVCQDIPVKVVNNPEYDWAPYSNKVWKDGEEVKLEPEGSARYSYILNTFRAEEKKDKYCPQLPTGIKRNFEGGMEVTSEEIESLFVKLISSPEIKEVAKMISNRLGRDLRPYDIWYDGFKSRSSISEDDLTAITRKKYPTPLAFQNDMPRMLKALGFSATDADFIGSKIVVEGARGSGHAWGAQGRWEPSRLRTRVSDKGMDYKGYNIAVHEFGHNVEQTLDLYNIDYFTLSGVPNTAFTETLAFIFQKRDLELLGFNHKFDDNTTLDIFWGAYEIMGVSLVDMYTWRWLYENPDATAENLKDNVIRIAREVWNNYYEPVLGTHDSPVLAIYSHMINAPMYLPNYPFGHLIEYQLEEYLSTMKSREQFASEIKRIYTLGRLTPQIWMQQAVGSNVSIEPMLKAIDEILKRIKDLH